MEAAEGSVAVEVGRRRTLVLCPRVGRVQVGLVLAPTDKLVDVTAQPSAAVRRVADTADREGTPMSAAEATCRRALGEAAGRAEAWHAPVGTDLLAWLGGAGFPFLRVAYEAGCLPLPEVPRWAVPILAEPTARAGAAAAFGAKATRRVVAALGATVGRNPGEAADLSRLALALLARDLAEPDQLAALLELPGPSWPLRALPSGRLLDEGRRAVRYWGTPRRALRLLSDAATVDDGPHLLAATIHFSAELNDHGPRRLSNRLAEAHAAYEARFAVAPPPPAAPRTPQRHRRAAARPGPAAGGRQPGGDAVAEAGPAGRGLRLGPGAAAAFDRGRRPAARGGGGAGLLGGEPDAPPAPLVAEDARLGAGGGPRGGQQPVPRRQGGRRARFEHEGGPAWPPAVTDAVSQQLTARTPLRFPPDVVAIDGLRVGTSTLVLPRSVGDLARWGELLHNCLGDYGRAVVAGRSVIIGVEVYGELRYALELTGDRRVRQFRGRGNVPPTPAVRGLVLDALEDRGVL